MAVGKDSRAIRDIHSLFVEGTTTGFSDEELLVRFAARGDMIAFQAIVARHGATVLAACRRRLRDANDVEDAFQATFLVLIRKAAAIRDPGRLGGWLYGTAVRVANQLQVDLMRRRSAERPWDEASFSKAAPSGVGDVDGLRRVIDAEVARLPARYREPILLCYLEGRSYAEAARRLECPVGTIRSRLARARERLRGRLERQGFASAVIHIKSVLSAGLADSAPEPSLLDAAGQVAVRFVAPRFPCPEAASARAITLARGVTRSMLFRKLPVVGASAIVLSLATLGTARQGPAPGPDAGRAASGRVETEGAEPRPAGRAEADLDRLIEEAWRHLESGDRAKASEIVDVLTERVQAERERLRAELDAFERRFVFRVEELRAKLRPSVAEAVLARHRGQGRALEAQAPAPPGRRPAPSRRSRA